jgi:hypothetical protein
METIEPIEHNHIEWSRRRTFFNESSHMHVFVISALIGQTMNEIRVPMISKNHGPVGREKPVEFSIGDPVRRAAPRTARTPYPRT